MMGDGPSQKMITRPMFATFSKVLLWFIIEQFHIQNMRLLGGNWDEGNFWILFSKSSAGLKPNVDFVSGYPCGFEALIFQLQN